MPEGQQDQRGEIYGDLHGQQLRDEKAYNEYSSRRILEILFQAYRPSSLLDVGCGLGTWLKTAQAFGVSDVQGIEGQWVDANALEVAPELVQTCDLEKGFALGRRFDLVICLEVAEHLAESAADTFIASLVRHGPAVLFSAAIPSQGGHHHVNERFLPYWVTKFAAHGFRPIDLIRAEIWDDDNVLWWLRQNMVLFVTSELCASNEKLRQASVALRKPLSLVHPALYMKLGAQVEQIREFVGPGGLFRMLPAPGSAFSISRVLGSVEELEALANFIREGGLFRVTRDESGSLTVSKVKE